MPTFLRSLLAFVTLGMCSAGCGKSDKPPAVPTDVTLNVPGMF
jgi:nitrous oxide reductase accessory protein NosL